MKASPKPKPTPKSIPALPQLSSERRTARLFTNGASQAVRLPKEFRMEGKEVRIWKEGDRVVMEPIDNGWEALFAALNEFPKDFVIERNQPPMQERDWEQGLMPTLSVAEPAPKPPSKPLGAKRKRP